MEKPWERISVNGQPHEHGFKLGSEKHTTEAIVQKSGVLQLTSGVEGLSLLKTTQVNLSVFFYDRLVLVFLNIPLPEQEKKAPSCKSNYIS